jgi:hypothetical protein
MRRQKCVMACAAPLHVVGCSMWSSVHELQYTSEAAAITIRARSGQLKEVVPVYARTLLRRGGPQGCRLGRWSASPRLLPPPVSRPQLPVRLSEVEEEVNDRENTGLVFIKSLTGGSQLSVRVVCNSGRDLCFPGAPNRCKV